MNNPTQNLTQNQFGNSELKPCPFCGGKAKITKSSWGHSSDYFSADYKIGCDGCGFYFKATSYFGVKDGVPFVSVDGYKEIVDKWNRRAADETQ